MAKPGDVGDQCFVEGLYTAARVLYTHVMNFGKLALCLVKLELYDEAVAAAKKANSIVTWKAVCFTCVDNGKFRLAQQCALNVIVYMEHLLDVLRHYELNGHFKEVSSAIALTMFICVLFCVTFQVCDCSCAIHLCSLHAAHANLTINMHLHIHHTLILQVMAVLEHGIMLERTHQGMFTQLGICYSKYCEEKLMEHVKLYWAKLNVPALIASCKENLHWPEVVFLYSHYDQYENAVDVMMDHAVDSDFCYVKINECVW
jgi:clathrin heavy chain